MECDSRHRLRCFLDRFGLGCDVAAESQLSTDLWHPVLNGGPVRARGSDDDDDVATLLRERETNFNHLHMHTGLTSSTPSFNIIPWRVHVVALRRKSRPFFK